MPPLSRIGPGMATARGASPGVAVIMVRSLERKAPVGVAARASARVDFAGAGVADDQDAAAVHDGGRRVQAHPAVVLGQAVPDLPQMPGSVHRGIGVVAGDDGEAAWVAGDDLRRDPGTGIGQEHRAAGHLVPCCRGTDVHSYVAWCSGAP